MTDRLVFTHRVRGVKPGPLHTGTKDTTTPPPPPHALVPAGQDDRLHTRVDVIRDGQAPTLEPNRPHHLKPAHHFPPLSDRGGLVATPGGCFVGVSTNAIIAAETCCGPLNHGGFRV